jgi:hypothetical protein
MEHEVLGRDAADVLRIPFRDVELDQSLLDLLREPGRFQGLVVRGPRRSPGKERGSEQLPDPHERCAPVVRECTSLAIRL